MIKTWLKDFQNLIYPNLCICCNQHLIKNEEFICFDCLINIPRTNFHLETNNPVEKLFWGRVNIEFATSYFYYNKGSIYQQIMHLLKYKHLPEIGAVMGKHFGAELFHYNIFNNVDLIIPIPLHKKKLIKRGYNQSEAIANGIGSILNIPISTNTLERIVNTNTQTRKSRFERWENVEGIFKVPKIENINNRHILLIDDVVTTGSTLEAAAQALLDSHAKSVSIATLACALI